MSWEAYPEEVVDRIWRTDAARLHRVLDESSPPPGAALPPEGSAPGRATLARVLDRLAQGGSDELAARISAHQQREEQRREERGREPALRCPPADPADPLLDVMLAAAIGPEGEPPTPVYQLLPSRTGRELLADHVTAMVCCAAVDTAGAAPGLDWLDGPTLLVDGVRRSGPGAAGAGAGGERRPRAAARLAERGRRTPGEAGPPGVTRTGTWRSVTTATAFGI